MAWVHSVGRLLSGAMSMPFSKWLAIFLIWFGATLPASAQPSIEGDVRAVQARQEAAWNAHDAHAFAQIFASDAEFIDVAGHRTTGRDAIERKLEAAFRSSVAQSMLHMDAIDVRPLGEGEALALVRWSSIDASAPDGTIRGIQTQILRRAEGGWQILAFHNSVILVDRAAIDRAPQSGPPPLAPADTRPCLLATSSGRCLIHKGR